jgi:butyryl-CoA dehydrogenase
MDFDLTEDQRMIREAAKEFAEKEIRPVAAEMDEKCEFPEEVIKKLGELGFMGMMVPEEYGGAGMDAISYAIAIEEISRVDSSVGVTMSVNNSLACQPLLDFGNDEQKKKYLPQLATGGMLGAFSLTEPEAGSDAGAVQTTAVLDGDHYVINGNKIFVTNGGKADLVLLFASTDRSLKSKGLTAFLVETKWDGFSVGKKENKMGMRASNTSELIFEDCRVPEENILGKPGKGLRIALTALDGGRIGIAAQSVGIGQACLDEALKYAKERRQFGKTICEFQAIQWMLADMAAEVESGRLLTYQAAHLKDKKKRYAKEAAMAKLVASEAAVRAAINAVQIHGGYGYMKEYPVERYFRDSKLTELYEGTSEIQRLVIAANLLKG